MIKGIDGMSQAEVLAEIDRGGRFVVYQYCFSVLVMTFKRSTDIHFVKAGQSRVTPGLGWTCLTLLTGWWGIPWGPIYSIQSLYTNFSGGRDVTDAVVRPQG